MKLDREKFQHEFDEYAIRATDTIIYTLESYGVTSKVLVRLANDMIDQDTNVISIVRRLVKYGADAGKYLSDDEVKLGNLYLNINNIKLNDLKEV